MPPPTSALGEFETLLLLAVLHLANSSRRPTAPRSGTRSRPEPAAPCRADRSTSRSTGSKRRVFLFRANGRDVRRARPSAQANLQGHARRRARGQVVGHRRSTACSAASKPYSDARDDGPDLAVRRSAAAAIRAAGAACRRCSATSPRTTTDAAPRVAGSAPTSGYFARAARSREPMSPPAGGAGAFGSSMICGTRGAASSHNPASRWCAPRCSPLGIGLSTAMFSVVDSLLLRPAPFRDADRLVRQGVTSRTEPTLMERLATRPACFRLWRPASDVVSSRTMPGRAAGLARSSRRGCSRCSVFDRSADACSRPPMDGRFE